MFVRTPYRQVFLSVCRLHFQLVTICHQLVWYRFKFETALKLHKRADIFHDAVTTAMPCRNCRVHQNGCLSIGLLRIRHPV